MRLILEILLVVCFMITSAIATGHTLKIRRYEHALTQVFGIAHNVKTKDGRDIEQIVEEAYNG